MARAAAGSSHEGLKLREAESGAVDAVDPNEVGPEVGYDDEVARGVCKDLMRVRGFLTRGIRAWLSERKRVRVDQREARLVEVVEPSDGGASTAAGWRECQLG